MIARHWQLFCFPLRKRKFKSGVLREPKLVLGVQIPGSSVPGYPVLIQGTVPGVTGYPGT
eukprot:1478121-Rhodomonas_salina.1